MSEIKYRVQFKNDRFNFKSAYALSVWAKNILSAWSTIAEIVKPHNITSFNRFYEAMALIARNELRDNEWFTIQKIDNIVTIIIHVRMGDSYRSTQDLRRMIINRDFIRAAKYTINFYNSDETIIYSDDVIEHISNGIMDNRQKIIFELGMNNFKNTESDHTQPSFFTDDELGNKINFYINGLDDLVNSSQFRISEIEKRYDYNVAAIRAAVIDRETLNEPTEHWGKKQARHSCKGYIWLGVSMLWLIAVLVLGGIGANWIATRVIAPATMPIAAQVQVPPPATLEPATATASAPTAATPPAAVPTAPAPVPVKPDTTLLIALVTTYVLVSISIFRFLTRMYRDEQRLADDADQRRTMMSSYLSMLLHKEKPVGAEERVLVLQALFRSAALTDVSDEIPAVNIADAILNAVKEKKGP